MKKNNAWNIRHLVDELFVPASQRASISYCRLSDSNSLIDFTKPHSYANEIVLIPRFSPHDGLKRPEDWVKHG